MKSKVLLNACLAAIIGALTFMYSCSEDDPAEPTISLSETQITAKAGETIKVTVTMTAEAGFNKLIVTKLWDGSAQNTDEITNITGNSYEFEYEVLVDDADYILSFNFKVVDKDGREAQAELVVEVELTMTQLLLKYDWLLADEVRVKTGESDISDPYTDDVYRFHADGSYDKSIGDKADSFSDLWFNYCYWNLNEETGMLIMTRTGAFLEDVRDTVNITKIDAEVMEGDVIYRGLDAFNTGGEAVPYEPVEEYVKKFAAQAKGSNFDPYMPGPDDDDTGPAKACNDIDW
ncbi:MAG: hypothetical protein MI975_15955 [Cytophagales bacterium]|nr:hypothetical protein [Cytophagales bacterium]